MPANSSRLGILRIAECFFICAVVLSGRVPAQTQAPSRTNDDPKTFPYNVRSFARAAGNLGRWWSLMGENEKVAFLDGYQTSMSQNSSRMGVLCKTLKDGVKPSTDQQAFFNEIAAVTFVCNQTSESEGFEKVTTKDLDDFYSDPVNQPILLEWSMGYLRDRATGRKTEGQLLDALRAEQKDVHDCSKYPNLCALGVKEPESR